jgi:spore maturation protein CgeB
VFVTSSFFVPPEHYDLIRQRGTKMVALLTESPYEDPAQYHIAARADMAIVNDPTNLETFRQHQPNTWYVPHAYDPTVHKPGPATARFKSDFGWVGTAYPSRRRFFEECDFTGLDVVLGGNWSELDDQSPLNDFLVNDKAHCLENSDAVEVYRSTKASVNLYRQEAAADEFVAGWAMGPREVELAATGTFYLTEPRPENQEVLPMVPTFTSPGEFSELLRWYLDHDDTRQDIARRAREAIAERTFANNCRFVLDRLANLPVPRLAGRKQQEPNREESNG